MKAAHPISANPANSIVVVCNMQNDFCKPGGAIFDERLPEEMPGVIDATRDVTQRARKAGVPIIHLRSVRNLDEPEFTVYAHQPYVKHGTWGAEIIDELKPEPEDLVIDVGGLSPFYETRLDYLLQGMVETPTANHVIIAGGDIGGFTFVAATDFYMRGYWTVALIDALYGDEEGRDFALNGRFSADSQKNMFLTRSGLVTFSAMPAPGVAGLVPGK